MAGEVERARKALGDIPTTVLASSPTGPPVTLSAISAALRDQPHILYLTAHGAVVENEPHLWLERPDGTSDPTSGTALVQMLANLSSRPLFVSLASCQSAGQSHATGALAALGPQLARAGVAAVLAMQGSVSMQTVERLMPICFHELRRNGAVDRALAAARAALRGDANWWLPVLFLRVRDGRIWHEPERLVGAPPPAQAVAPQRFHTQLRQVLRSCDEFGSNAALRAVFVAPELRPWQGGLPEADSLHARVNLTIAYLEAKRHARGTSALELFLHALAAAYDPDDTRHDLLKALAQAAASRDAG